MEYTKTRYNIGDILEGDDGECTVRFIVCTIKIYNNSHIHYFDSCGNGGIEEGLTLITKSK